MLFRTYRISPFRPAADKIKSSPMDIEVFHNETSIKYPTFLAAAEPPPSFSEAPFTKLSPAVLTSRLAKAYTPIPVRHHYHHEEIEAAHGGHQHGMQSQFYPQQPPMHHQNQGGFRPNPQPATPAPSPPPSPKPKKQQYQTDQTRPFLFPFSRSQAGKLPRLVPFAIDEADRLYNRHMYISLSLAQMWSTREDCMTVESGLDRMPGADAGFKFTTFNPDVSFPIRHRLSDIIMTHEDRTRKRRNLFLTSHFWTKKSKKRSRPWRMHRPAQKNEKLKNAKRTSCV